MKRLLVVLLMTYCVFISNQAPVISVITLGMANSNLCECDIRVLMVSLCGGS